MGSTRSWRLTRSSPLPTRVNSRYFFERATQEDSHEVFVDFGKFSKIVGPSLEKPLPGQPLIHRGQFTLLVQGGHPRRQPRGMLVSQDLGKFPEVGEPSLQKPLLANRLSTEVNPLYFFKGAFYTGQFTMPFEGGGPRGQPRDISGLQTKKISLGASPPA